MEQKNNSGETPPYTTEQILIATYAIMVKSMEIAAKFSLALLALLEELETKGIINRQEIEAKAMTMGKDVVGNIMVDSKDIEYLNSVMTAMRDYANKPKQ